MALVLNGSGITSANIADGTIVNADINSSAAIDGSKLTGVGKVLQVVNFHTGAVASGTTLIPYDDTIPQITEGVEYMTLAITPTSATSKLKIEVSAVASVNAITWMVIALFQDATAGALASSYHYQSASTGTIPFCFNHYMTAGTTSATTFRIRIGSSDAGTTTFSGDSSLRRHGGTMASSITITEIKA